MDILDNSTKSFLKAHAGKKIVFTNGCFDILHLGHVEYLTEAKSLGDVLIIGLNSDASVKRLKGSDRPINNESDRAKMLLSLKAVDCVQIFDEDTPKTIIELISPDILVKGGDWKVEEIVGSDFVIKNGGIVRSLMFKEGHSTTNVIKSLQGRK